MRTTHLQVLRPVFLSAEQKPISVFDKLIAELEAQIAALKEGCRS